MPPEPHDLYYRRLQIGQNASHEEIVQAYRRLAHGTHPDAHPGDAEAPERFRAITEAYEVLADPQRRAAYDSSQHVAPAQTSSSRGNVEPPVPGRRPRPSSDGAPRSGFLAPPGGAGSSPLRAGPVRIERAGTESPDEWLISTAGDSDSSWRLFVAMLDAWRRR